MLYSCACSAAGDANNALTYFLQINAVQTTNLAAVGGFLHFILAQIGVTTKLNDKGGKLGCIYCSKWI